MYILRPITRNDQKAMEIFAYRGEIGLASLPRNPERLNKKLLHSIESFSKETIDKPAGEVYLFILEDLKNKTAIGISGVYANSSFPEPSYFYRIETVQHECPFTNKTINMQVLDPLIETNDDTEIGSLFLLPEYRKEGLGRLLSLSRFLFMAAFPQRFKPTVIAILRGYVRPDKSSPFWDGIGRHFCHIPFLDLIGNLSHESCDFKGFFSEYPLYLSLLSQETQECIGKTNENTKPALTLLTKEGFTTTLDIDSIDGGPKLTSPLKNIRTFKESKVATVQHIYSDPIQSENYLLSNERLDFRACIGQIKKESDSTISIHEETAKSLNISQGDKIRYIVAEGKTP